MMRQRRCRLLEHGSHPIVLVGRALRQEKDSACTAPSPGSRPTATATRRNSMYMYTQGHSRIVSSGTDLPDERITAREMLEQVDAPNLFGVSLDWLERVSGIHEQRVAPTGMLPSDMAVLAAREAMERAKLLPQSIDAIIYTG